MGLREMRSGIAAKGAVGIVVYHLVHYCIWLLFLPTFWLLDIDPRPIVNAIQATFGYEIVMSAEAGRLASAWVMSLIFGKVAVPFKIWATYRLLPAAEGPLRRTWQTLRRLPLWLRRADSKDRAN